MSFASPSPPPLRHPVPTHPAQIPEPPSTPNSPSEYQRFSSSSSPSPQQQQQQPQQFYNHPSAPTSVPAYGYSMPPPPPQQPQAFTSPFQHNAQHGHPAQQQQQQQQQHPGQPGFQQPDLSAWGVNDMTTQLGMQFGSNALHAGQQYMQRNFGSIIPAGSLKVHFNVSNSYVLNKLRVLLFPWTHKPWGRRVRRSDKDVTEWQTPREDINAPDLYIPLMAVVTYVLLSALQKGIRNDFHASVLGDSASRAIIVLVLDFIFVKIGCFLLNVQTPGQGGVDLVAYGGYKFVGVIATVIFDLLQFGRTVWTAVFLYCFFANAFFLLRSLRSLVLPSPDGSATGQSASTHRRRRITFLFIEAVTQIVWMGILVRV